MLRFALAQLRVERLKTGGPPRCRLFFSNMLFPDQSGWRRQMSDSEGDVGDRKLRVAVVGLGGNGSSFARLYSNHPKADLVAACDINEERSDFASSLGATFLTDYRAVAALDD